MMKKVLKYFMLVAIISFVGCGGSSKKPRDNNVENGDTYIPTPSGVCKDDEFKRVKTNECIKLQNPSWGFQGFSVSNEYNLSKDKCDQDALQAKLDEAYENGGGKVIMPECSIDIENGIILKDNIMLEGAGIGKTILNNLGGDSVVNLHGKNIIVRNFTVDKQNLGQGQHGINGYQAKGNILVEFIEVKNVGNQTDSYNSGISFYTNDPLKNSNITIRYNIVSGGFIGIDFKVQSVAKALIYSNISSNNTQYGIDMSTNIDIEVAGNYLHDNDEAGAKSPAADNIIYHHNDINYNKKAGLVYGSGHTKISKDGTNSIVIEDNNLSNNDGPAFTPWMGGGVKLKKLTLKNNIVTNSTDDSGYNVLVGGIDDVTIVGDHGEVWQP